MLVNITIDKTDWTTLWTINTEVSGSAVAIACNLAIEVGNRVR